MPAAPGVEQAGGDDDRRAVLVVVKHWDVQKLAKLLLDREAFRCLDVFEVDAAEGRRQRPDDADDLFGIGGVDLDIEDVDVGKALEQQTLALHHRLAGLRAEVAETENGAAVADDADQIAFGGVLVRLLGIVGDFLDRDGDARGVGQAQVVLGQAGLRRNHLDLALAALGMVAKDGFAGHFLHGNSPLAKEFRRHGDPD